MLYQLRTVFVIFFSNLKVEKKHYGTKFTGVETELIWEGDADYPFEFGNIYDFMR